MRCSCDGLGRDGGCIVMMTGNHCGAQPKYPPALQARAHN